MAHQQPRYGVNRRQPRARSIDDDEDYEVVDVPYTRSLPTCSSKRSVFPKPTAEAKVMTFRDEEAVSRFYQHHSRSQSSANPPYKPSLVYAEEEIRAPDVSTKDGNDHISENEAASVSHFTGQIDSFQSQLPRTPRSLKSNSSLRTSSNVDQESHITHRPSSHPSISLYDNEEDVLDPTENFEANQASETYSEEEMNAIADALANSPRMLRFLENNEMSDLEEHSQVKDAFPNPADETEDLGHPESDPVSEFEKDLKDIGAKLGEFLRENDIVETPAIQHSLGSEEQLDEAEKGGMNLPESLRDTKDPTNPQTIIHTETLYASSHHDEESSIPGSAEVDDPMIFEGCPDEYRNSPSELFEQAFGFQPKLSQLNLLTENFHESSRHHEVSSIPGSPEIAYRMVFEDALEESENSSFEPSEDVIISQPPLPSPTESLGEWSQQPQDPEQTSSHEQASEPSDGSGHLPFQPTGDRDWDQRVMAIYQILTTIDASQLQTFTVLATIILRQLGEMSDAELQNVVRAVFDVNTLSDAGLFNSQSMDAEGFHDETIETESAGIESSNSIAPASDVISYHDQATQTKPVGETLKLKSLYERIQMIDNDSVLLIMVFLFVVILLNGLTFLWVSMAKANSTSS
ncbi:uncharacterized protein KD926_004287 [Aspergillus affinis]|uniref:uncharacterized protein n=1 Tax=Aspergillus affinis TaxID=1070780 RepID=UPI0022FE6736|nr:uncharacterized protein KD926_004287 [Aspergillus affinis]KAI9035203.1 hypothetical protein KD926_004287 [Aspergillus affinis]